MSNLDALPDFARTNKLKLANIKSSSVSQDWEDRIEDSTAEEANLVTSIAWEDGAKTIHYPLLDLDFPAALLDSSTPNHYHLYIKKAMSWQTYQDLLKALYDAEIIQHGVYINAVKRGFSSLRMPHVKKGDEKLNHPFKSEKEERVEALRAEIQAKQDELLELLYGKEKDDAIF
jgi:hypothetical protein